MSTCRWLGRFGRIVAGLVLCCCFAAGCSAVKTADGVDYAIGDIRSADGVTRIRLVCEDNVPHWPTPELSRLVCDFFAHFSRDPETGESVYCE